MSPTRSSQRHCFGLVMAALIACPGVAAAGCAGHRAELVLAAGVEAHRAGDHVAAALKYREALRLDPEVRGAWRNLSTLALIAKRPADAVDLAREETRLHPDDPAAAAHLALVQLRADHTEAAIATLRPLVAPPRGDADRLSTEEAARRALVADHARLLLSVALWRLGRFDEAVRPLEPLLSIEHGATFAAERAVLASKARVVGSWLALSREQWQRVLDEPAAHPIAQTWAAYRSGGAAPQPEADVTVAVDAGQRAWIALLTAMAPEASLDGLGVALDVSAPLEVRVAALRLRASRAAAAGAWADALSDLDAAASALPDPPADLWLDRAVALAHVGRVEDARLAVAGVLRDDPGNTRAVSLQGLVSR